MAANDYDPIDGSPLFLDSDAPDIKVDPRAVAIYAADVGNRIIRANLAELDDYDYARDGLAGIALDSGVEYRHDGSGWVPAGIGSFKSIQVTEPGGGTVTNGTSMGALTTVSLSTGVTTGIACRAKITLRFKFAANAVGCGAAVGVAGSGATTITPSATAVDHVQVLQQAINQTNTYSGSWFVNLNAGTTTLAVVGQAIGVGGTRSIAALSLLVEPVSE